ncbi:hypothetical protein ACLOJK_028377 [Asimina triloba]
MGHHMVHKGLPCHLYFDLEFDKKVNPEKDGVEMVDILISVIFDLLMEKYAIQGDQKWVVELDSSTKEKFSRHLIIHIPEMAFKDNSHVGAFVAESQQQIFMESLICRMDAECGRLLICKVDLDCKKTLSFDSEVNSNYEQSSEALQEISNQACLSNLPGTYLTGKSPFPSLDVFVESIASSGNVAGRIRSWYWFSEYGLMVYNMSRNSTLAPVYKEKIYSGISSVVQGAYIKVHGQHVNIGQARLVDLVQLGRSFFVPFGPA